MSKTRAARWPLWEAQARRRYPRPLHTFRVRAERSSRLCVYVEVYQTRAALRAASACDRVPGYRRSTIVAECAEVVTHRQWWRGSKVARRRRRPEFAILRLTTKSRTRDITHECFHATLRWAKRRGYASLVLNRTDSRAFAAHALEERLAVVHENLCAGVVDGLFDFGVLK